MSVYEVPEPIQNSAFGETGAGVVSAENGPGGPHRATLVLRSEVALRYFAE